MGFLTMPLILSIIIISFVVAVALATIALTLGKKSLTDREKLTPFECGFSPNKKARAPFSLRFFIVTILFLIFDVEVALLLPLGILAKYSNPLMLTFTAATLTVVLILGLLHE
jgi:NADH-ubiquinone oxidoreductase chain 3